MRFKFNEWLNERVLRSKQASFPCVSSELSRASGTFRNQPVAQRSSVNIASQSYTISSAWIEQRREHGFFLGYKNLDWYFFCLAVVDWPGLGSDYCAYRLVDGKAILAFGFDQNPCVFIFKLSKQDYLKKHLVVYFCLYNPTQQDLDSCEKLDFSW